MLATVERVGVARVVVEASVGSNRRRVHGDLFDVANTRDVESSAHDYIQIGDSIGLVMANSIDSVVVKDSST